MPHNPKVKKRKKPAEILIGETPKTIFKDYLTAINVDLIYSPDQSIKLTAYGFQKATWADKPFIPGRSNKEDRKMLKSLKIDALEGNGLPLSLELFDFVFAISGISRIITHQIVRNRIGATYSQQCSGDKDWRHHAVLVPRTIYQNKELYKKFKDSALKAKSFYAEMLDTMEVPILDARRVLPHCVETFIYVKFNLITIISFIKKRDCVQTQEPEMVILARKMRETILHRFPELEYLLKNECKEKKCFYSKSDRLVGTSMFIPDDDHDFEYNKENFIYSKNVREMIYDVASVPEEHYLGFKKVK